MARHNIISILEGTLFGTKAQRRLKEEHWSNLLAWLFSPSFVGEQCSCFAVSQLLHLANIKKELSDDQILNIERERPYDGGNTERFIDIVVSFSKDWELHIENKVDRDYEDPQQLLAEASALNNDDFLILLCPRGFSLLTHKTQSVIKSNQQIRHVRWLDYSTMLMSSKKDFDTDPLAAQFLSAISLYWTEREKEDFLWQAETIIEEQGWERFYPDDFKAVYVKRFEDIYDQWVQEKGGYGNGGAHQLLTLKIAGLARRGFLKETGNKRPPKDSNWGYPEVYEYEVVKE